MSVIGQLPAAESNLYHQRRTEPLKQDARGAWFANKISPLITPPLVVAAWALARLKGLPKARVYRDIAPHFVDHYAPSLYPSLTKALELKICREIPIEEPSLEVGVGDGYFSKLLYRDQKLTYAGDLIYETLLASRDKQFAREVAVMDADEIPLPDNSLKTYFMNNLMHHLPDRQKTLAEAHRVLQPGGLFLFNDNTISWAAGIWHIWLAERLGFKSWARRKLDEKLHNCAQALIENADWWLHNIDLEQWEVVRSEPFFSNRSYLLCSLLESLTFKQGGPVAASLLKKFMRVPMARTIYRYLLPDLAERLMSVDQEWARRFGSIFTFVVLRKKGDGAPQKPQWVCPETHQPLQHQGTSMVSPSQKVYLVDQEVPILLRYWEKLPGYQEHLARIREQGYPEYLT